MAEILISVAAKVAEYLIDPITLQLSYPFNYHRHVQDLLQKFDTLGHAREKVEILVTDAIRQGDKIIPHVHDWLEATEGILRTKEDFVQDERQASQQGCFHLKSRYNLSKKAMRQGQDIEAKLQQARDIGDTVSCPPSPPPVIDSASSTNYAAYPSRQSIFNQIMDSLGNGQASIVGLWGMGGVGKTTLAQQVAKRAEEENLFDKVVMASSISQTPNISEIQQELAKPLGLRFPDGEDKSVRLMKSLKNQKKVLVILDDLWDELDLRKIGIPYGDDHKGCKLLLTSREKHVVAIDMMAQQVFHLPHLEPREAWSLFKRTAGDSVEHSPELKATADEIVKKCEGLPIAIVTVANALQNQSVGQWKNALKELKMAKPRNIRGMSNNVYSCVKLSYNHLEGDEVKSLFLLCGLLGGRHISKDDLLLYATGLNMFEGRYSMEEATNKLITLVQKLIASSLLLDAEGQANDRYRSLFFDDLFVKMHDVVRDVARSIAAEDVRPHYVVSEAVELREWERRGEYKNYNGISLECEDMDRLPPRLVCPELELFLLNSSFDRHQWRPHWESLELGIPEDFFQGITKLRVLHMSLVSLKPSSSLSFLSSLRTLCLIKCQLDDMRIIGEMKGLQVLSLAKSNIVKLPKEIGELKDLRVLDLEDCFSLRMIPRNVISSLSGLECLSLRGCDGIEWGRGGESNNNNKASLSEIKDLPQLRNLELRVSDPSLIPEDIWLDLANLTRYSIVIGTETIDVPNKLARTLSAGRIKSPIVLRKCFSNLFETCQLLSLVGLDGISNMVYDLANENGFPQLELLTISACLALRHIVSSSLKWVPPRDTFRSLDRLHLYNLHNLESVLDFHESAPILIECFGKLRSLRIKWCHKLRCVMSLPMQHGRELNFFPRLQMLELGNLTELNNFYSIATPEQHSQGSMSVFFNQQATFPALEELEIERLGNHLQALWHNQFPACSFSKLKKLDVSALGELKNVFPVSFVKALVQLEELSIRWSESVKEIVANEGHEDISDEAAFFPKLTHLKLYYLVLLKRFCSRAIKLRWPLLKELSVVKCGDQAEVLFEEIGLEGEVDAPPLFPVEKTTFPKLETLSIEDLNGVAEIWRGQFSRVSFSKLRVLSIKECHGISIVISSTVIQNLHNLEELKVTECGSVKEVIQLLDDEPTKDEIDFSKLKMLHLSRLPNLKGFCLATCTFRFPSLEDLHLSKCPEMEFFCKGALHITKKNLEEYILRVLASNAQAGISGDYSFWVEGIEGGGRQGGSSSPGGGLPGLTFGGGLGEVSGSTTPGEMDGEVSGSEADGDYGGLDWGSQEDP